MVHSTELQKQYEIEKIFKVKNLEKELFSVPKKLNTTRKNINFNAKKCYILFSTVSSF